MPQETLHFANARQLSQLFNHDPRNLEEVERVLGVRLASRDDWVEIEGSPEVVARVKVLFELLEGARKQGIHIRSSDFHFTLRCVVELREEELRGIYADPLVIRLKRQTVVPKTLNQKRYLQAIAAYPVTFGIGPAGTGKTYLAMAMALQELLNGAVERIILTRLGDGSRMVVTGDITQIDLPRSKQSGLREAMRVLHKVESIKLFQFEGPDVVRHPLVQEIINAYAQHTPE